MSTVIVGGGATRVRIASPSAQRVTVDRSTIAKIADNRGAVVTLPQVTPVLVDQRDTRVKTGGGMGVQGPPGTDGTPGGPPGPIGATGPAGKDGQIRFTGHGAPPTVIVGASPGDTYLDLDAGDIYKLE